MESEHKGWVLGVLIVCSMFLGIIIAVSVSNTSIAYANAKVGETCATNRMNWVPIQDGSSTFKCVGGYKE